MTFFGRFFCIFTNFDHLAIATINFEASNLFQSISMGFSLQKAPKSQKSCFWGKTQKLRKFFDFFHFSYIKCCFWTFIKTVSMSFFWARKSLFPFLASYSPLCNGFCFLSSILWACSKAEKTKYFWKVKSFSDPLVWC